MTKPSPLPIARGLTPRAQDAAVSPCKETAAASPSSDGFKPAGPMFLAAIAHIPVPKVVKQ